MPEVIAPPARTPKEPRNGVNTPVLLDTINAVRQAPALAKFRFRASNRWIGGTHSVSRVESFSGAGGEHTHKKTFTVDADHPAVLVGDDNAPLPVEYALYALGACIMSGISNIAAARGVTLTEVEAAIEGDMDLRGILGLSPEVRNGYEGIRATFTIKGDAPEEKLREVVEQARARSAVYDIITNKVPVQIGINVG
jgi:uncharacterized OsmC-like protein